MPPAPSDTRAIHTSESTDAAVKFIQFVTEYMSNEIDSPSSRPNAAPIFSPPVSVSTFANNKTYVTSAPSANWEKTKVPQIGVSRMTSVAEPRLAS